MQALLDVILPVFFVIGAGYIAVWRGWFPDSAVEGLLKYSQNFAIPALLFSAISRLDLATTFDAKLLAAFYTGAFSCFLIGLLAARYGFKRDWEEAVAVGFVCLFSNSIMLGLPITERAYGVEGLAGNFAIVSIHSPFCYGLGITAMEIARARGTGGTPASTAAKVLRAMFRNALVLGILAGFATNLAGLSLPSFAADGLSLIVRSALPVALFALGGVIVRYRPQGDAKIIALTVSVSLLVHPAIVWSLGSFLALPTDHFRSAVLTSAMAPGVNSYVFASMYGTGRRVAASTVLIGTALSLITVWSWLHVIP
ncbi:MAG TPA: AEC family transporter [Rhodobacteraceae bacterium]|jgi:malonate transporter|nr:AEC family transporter [Paracoccaceae bacterium]HBV54654.1 AEC family transporter [Paracoccaceae bacterium]